MTKIYCDVDDCKKLKKGQCTAKVIKLTINEWDLNRNNCNMYVPRNTQLVNPKVVSVLITPGEGQYNFNVVEKYTREQLDVINNLESINVPLRVASKFGHLSWEEWRRHTKIKRIKEE